MDRHGAVLEELRGRMPESALGALDQAIDQVNLGKEAVGATQPAATPANSTEGTEPTNTAETILGETEEPTVVETETSKPEKTKELTPTKEPRPTDEPKPTQEPKPTKEPKPTDEPKPTQEPKPTDEPKPTKESKSTPEPVTNTGSTAG